MSTHQQTLTRGGGIGAETRRFTKRGLILTTVLLVAAITIGSVVQMSGGDETPAPTTPSLSQAEFIEINTTALPLAVSQPDTAVVAVPPVDRFIAINTVEMPPANGSLDEAASREFLYWNIDALELEGTDAASTGGVSPTGPTNGPR